MSDGNLESDGICAKAGNNRIERALERRAGAIELINKTNARDAIFVRLAPNSLGLRLDSGDAIEHRHCTVKDAQTALNFHREIYVAGRVDDVNAMIDAVPFPETSRRSRGDGDAALLLLLHPVHGRRALVHLADLVRDARVIKDTFRGGGLTGIDVGHDADIPELAEVVLSHCFW